MAKNCKNGGQNGLRDGKGGLRGGRNQTVGLSTGQSAGSMGEAVGHAGGPTDLLVVGPFLASLEAVSKFLWEKDS